MRILKSHPLLKIVNSYMIDSPQPSNISYLWNFGSLLGACLVIQIITGVTLAMHYNPSVLEAFNSVEHIMRDVNNGWLIRYLHSNTASAFFFIVYLHIGRGLYYGSYRAPRTLVWTLGTVIFILMIVTAFLGYVLPYGQMSLWGATVITNLMSAVPWIGQDIVEFLWGGFSVNNATLNRFFALHFVLPFVLAALVIMHLIALHDSAGSGNPLGVSGNYDRLPFAPYFLFKDLITIFILIIILSVFVFFMPNVLGDSENYVMANPMQTPPAIVPEWYLLPFYAILRSIPNKLLGVIAMFSAILIILAMPFTDLSRSRGIQFRPLSKIAFFIFVGNFLILMQLGAKHVESPFIELGQISTVIYFAHFLIIVPLVSLIENSLIELSGSNSASKINKQKVIINSNKANQPAKKMVVARSSTSTTTAVIATGMVVSQEATNNSFLVSSDLVAVIAFICCTITFGYVLFNRPNIAPSRPARNSAQEVETNLNTSISETSSVNVESIIGNSSSLETVVDTTRASIGEGSLAIMQTAPAAIEPIATTLANVIAAVPVTGALATAALGIASITNSHLVTLTPTLASEVTLTSGESMPYVEAERRLRALLAEHHQLVDEANVNSNNIDGTDQFNNENPDLEQDDQGLDQAWDGLDSAFTSGERILREIRMLEEGMITANPDFTSEVPTSLFERASSVLSNVSESSSQSSYDGSQSSRDSAIG